MIKPKILVSKCLNFEPVRWNGIMIKDEFVESLKKYVDFVTVCPEMEIGLGVPREPVRLVLSKGELNMVQSKTGENMTGSMKKFSKDFLKNSLNFDGVILKEKSPSCGIRTTKIYNEKNVVIGKGNGLFAQAVIEKYSKIPIETEGRMKNLYLKENFLTKIFTIANFRNLEKNIDQLVRYHTINKFLFMSYNQKMLRELGKVVANHSKLDEKKVFKIYEDMMLDGLKINYKRKSVYNTALHIMGYMKNQLKKEEKKFILENLDGFLNEKSGINTILILLKSYVIRFNIDYLLKQSFFEPFPKELI